MAEAKGVSTHALVLAALRHKWPNIVHIAGARKIEHVREMAQVVPTVRFTRSELQLIDGMKKGK